MKQQGAQSRQDQDGRDEGGEAKEDSFEAARQGW